MTLTSPDTLLASAAALVRQRFPLRTPGIGIVLGSGLGGLAGQLEDARSIPFRDIPGFVDPRVPGHRGVLLHGTLGGREVLALAGRFHFYEGYTAAETAFPIRVLRALGASVLVVSNAAGGIRRSFAAGQLVAISDHINLAFRNPLIGPVMAGDARFPDMSEPYDHELREILHDAARTLRISLEQGVYGWLTGPTYETPAEVRMLERLGVDMVGMSTVPEVLVAKAAGMRVVGVTCVANPAAGLSSAPIVHEDVIDVTARAAEAFERLIIEFVRRVDGSSAS